MFDEKVYLVNDEEFIEIVQGSKSINQVAEALGFKFSPGKNSRNKIKERMKNLNIELGEKQKQYKSKIESQYSGSNRIGRVGEKYFEFICAKYNISCLKEDSNCEPYDYIIDINNKLLKIQVKTTEYKEPNGIATSFCTNHGNFYNTCKRREYNLDDFDYYFLFCIESEIGYLYKPSKIVDKIRVWDRKPNNGIATGIVFGDDIIISKVFDTLKGE